MCYFFLRSFFLSALFLLSLTAGTFSSAAQVVTNACATQALVSVLLNAAGRPGLALGDELAGLRDFCVGAALGPEDAGLALGNSAAIRGAHNSFRPPAPPLREERDDDPAGEAFHFVAYVPAAGGLYELDGLKAGPIRLCDCAEVRRASWASALDLFYKLFFLCFKF